MPPGGLQFQHLARNVAFSQRFRRPPGVRNASRRPLNHATGSPKHCLADSRGRGGLQFQHLARNVAFSQRFGRPPGVRNASRRPLNHATRGTPISTLGAKRCVFATFREASGGQKRLPKAFEPCHGIPETLLGRFQGPWGTPISTLGAKRCVFATFREASGGQKRLPKAFEPCHQGDSNFNTWRETLRFRNVSGGLRGSETPPEGLRTMPRDPRNTDWQIREALRGGQGDSNLNTWRETLSS